METLNQAVKIVNNLNNIVKVKEVIEKTVFVGNDKNDFVNRRKEKVTIVTFECKYFRNTFRLAITENMSVNILSRNILTNIMNRTKSLQIN